MAKVIENKSTNPNLKQSESARELKISSSTLQRYRREINMFSPYRIPPSTNTHTRKRKTSNHTEHDLKMASKDLKMTSTDFKMTSKDVIDNGKPVFKKLKTKTNLKGSDTNEDIIHGRDLIEQHFSSN